MGLFGGSSSSSTTVKPWKPAREPLKAGVSGLYEASQTPFEYYPNQTYADMDPRQQEALQQLEQLARGQMPGMASGAIDAWQNALTAPDVANNPYVQGLVDVNRELINRNLTESTLPALTRSAVGNMGNTRFNLAAGLAARGAGEDVSRSGREILGNAYQQGLQARQGALGLAPSMFGVAEAPSQALGRVGDLYRTEAQRAIDEDRARYEFAQEEPWKRNERLISGTLPVGQAFLSTKQKEGSSPSVMGALGQTALGIGSMFAGGPASAVSGLRGMFGGGGSGTVSTPLGQAYYGGGSNVTPYSYAPQGEFGMFGSPSMGSYGSYFPNW